MATSDSEVESGARGRVIEMKPLNSRRQAREGQRKLVVQSKEDMIRAWRPIFDQFDHDGDGKVPLAELSHIFRGTPEGRDVPQEVIDDILDMADSSRDGYLDFEEFINMVRGQAIGAHRPMVRRMVQYAAFVVVPRKERRKTVTRYINEYSCFPPPLFIPLISAIEIALFAYFSYTTDVEGPIKAVGPIPTESDLIYDPTKRYQAWRFLSYMLVHAGWTHIIFNVLIQVVLGLPLEMVHHWWRILLIYCVGVICGSLGTSITDPNVYLVGASAGVYAIMAAHLSAVILNWSEMDFGWFRLVFFFVLTGIDVGVAVYHRYMDVDTKDTVTSHVTFGSGSPDSDHTIKERVMRIGSEGVGGAVARNSADVASLSGEKLHHRLRQPLLVGYAAHLGGALAGLLLGIVVLRNLRKQKWELYVWWVSLVLLAAIILAMMAWNVAFPSYFPAQTY
ncbi:unnamed protein product [Notodromas monacha]|uniref:EF-hand domain-containing protein n=1 Tax=Notodromas monacha TaxID=399045 RepID=A0A7R9BLJ6_9CRUS|nr:unnamed protein product [Notodromas monacha]CAG0916631.1 unnamed protein product [Notodromas monacha]